MNARHPPADRRIFFKKNAPRAGRWVYEDFVLWSFGVKSGGPEQLSPSERIALSSLRCVSNGSRLVPFAHAGDIVAGSKTRNAHAASPCPCLHISFTCRGVRGVTMSSASFPAVLPNGDRIPRLPRPWPWERRRPPTGSRSARAGSRGLRRSRCSLRSS